MSEASAYRVEEIQQKLESSYEKLINYLRKSSRAISAKKDLADYEEGLKTVSSLIEKTLDEYPDDEEMKKISDRFETFYTDRHKFDVKVQKEKVSNFLSDFKSLAHWRKMETSYGKTLGFSDFRSLRGESKKR